MERVALNFNYLRIVINELIERFVEMYLDLTEIKDLIEGRMKYRKCPCCDTNGLVRFDSTKAAGMLPYPPPGIPEEDLDWETCHNCNGLSYILYY